MFNSLLPHGLQHTEVLCPPWFPGVCSNSCPLNQWFYVTISSSVAPFSSCLQSFPASRSLPMSLLLTSCGQSIGASASVLSMNIHGWFPLGLADLISLDSKGLSRVFSSTTTQKHQFFITQPFYGTTLTAIHYYWKKHNFDYMDLCQQWSLCSLMCCLDLT